jgi:hypothetical protein
VLGILLGACVYIVGRSLSCVMVHLSTLDGATSWGISPEADLLRDAVYRHETLLSFGVVLLLATVCISSFRLAGAGSKLPTASLTKRSVLHAVAYILAFGFLSAMLLTFFAEYGYIPLWNSYLIMAAANLLLVLSAMKSSASVWANLMLLHALGTTWLLYRFSTLMLCNIVDLIQ